MPVSLEERVAALESKVEPSRGRRIRAAAKQIGVISLITASVIGCLVAANHYLQVRAQLDAALTKSMELNSQLAKAEYRVDELKARTDNSTQVVKRLEALNSNELKRVLELVERPGFKDVLHAGELAVAIDTVDQKAEQQACDLAALADRAAQTETGQRMVAKQVADIYGLAAWTYQDVYRDEGNAFRDLLAGVWNAGLNDDLKVQQRTGTVPAKWFNFASGDDRWMRHVYRASVSQRFESTTLDGIGKKWKALDAEIARSKRLEKAAEAEFNADLPASDKARSAEYVAYKREVQASSAATARFDKQDDEIVAAEKAKAAGQAKTESKSH
jgi:hypothetical protein